MIKYPDYNKLTASFFQFDMIRLQKLLHMSQNAILLAILCFFIGIKVNQLFYIKNEDVKNESFTELSIKTLLQLLAIIISTYYIRKFTKFIPFIFRFTESYNPYHISSDGEGLIGASIAMSLLLMSTQTNMRKRMNILISRTTKQVNDTSDDFIHISH